MNFLDFDLKFCTGGSVSVTTLEGVESDVFLMQSHDVSRYKSSQSVKYWGGHYNKSPIRITIPHNGNWHIVVIPIGGAVKAAVQVMP